ncbi:MAG: hypothetical protein M3P89_14845 [Actinomycetota bacterium]|nr:hypothetical protein [Actinomycetota bacterium]
MDSIRLDPQYTWRGARRSGVSRQQIAEDGVALARGLYISRSVDPDLLTRCRAWALVLPEDAAFNHATAGELLGAPVAPSPVPHVALTPRRVLPQWTGLAVHGRRLQPQDVMLHHGLSITSGAQTFLDLAPSTWPGDLVAIGDSLLRGGHMTVDTLTERLARADRVRGVVRARACAPLLSGKAMSRPESLIRYWVATSDLPSPRAQIPVHDRWGVVRAHADLGFEQWKVALEYEGRQHADDDQFGRDIDRYSLMAADGWVTLRFAKRQLIRAVILDRTRRTLVSRGWRPPPRVGC